jgi:hypothetical protein
MLSFVNHLLHCIRGLFKALLVVEGRIPRWNILRKPWKKPWEKLENLRQNMA